MVVQAIDFVANEVFMKSANESLKGLWRPNMSSRMWLMYAVGVLMALLFTFIFVKGREGKGVAEGIRYGIIIWLFCQCAFEHRDVGDAADPVHRHPQMDDLRPV